MSEQEKKEAIVTEGTVTETTDERSWLKKFVDAHPKAWKWAKRIGAGIGIGAATLTAFELGKVSGAKSVQTETAYIEGETEETTMDEE